MPRARTSDKCPQHHGRCEPWDRHPHTIRARDDDWEDAQDTHGAAELAGYIAETMQARRGKLRCRRCLPGSPPVPLISGDLTGKPLDEWINAAVRQAEGQHPRHEPVWLGAEPSGSVAPVTDGSLLRARARTRPGAAVFMEPGSEPVITTVPEVPDHSRKAGRR